MNYREALAWLFGTQLFGIKLGLENIQRLLRALNLPAPNERIIHVAGTNGKGSVCAMIDSILRAHGYRTGLFTSPHLITFRERIQVDGEMVSESAVAAGLTTIRGLIRDWQSHPTFFEIATALGLLHFRHEAAEFVVLETGMGGRLDATNAVTPIVSVITPIDYDHQKWLGHSLGEIAAEKAGIIKPHLPVVSASQPEEAAAIIRARAEDCAAPLHFVVTPNETIPPALAGAHQKQNAALALAALTAAGIELDDEAVARGLTSVRWPARFQQWNEHLVIDGAHNPAGAHVLARTWREVFGNARATIILAILRDKDVDGIVAALAPITARFVLPQMRNGRAFPPEELAQKIAEDAPDISVQIASSVSVALRETDADPTRKLVTGSLHFAGETLAVLEGNPDALEDCSQ
ncbi:MAG: bifunctional folylpolyglutamate synthase/dihydrofolate synthase [Chthoniobacterales bacterium]